MLEFAIDGHDGSAKTPILEGVRDALVASGITVATEALFHRMNEQRGEEIYPLWAFDEGADVLVELFQTLEAQVVDRSYASGADVLLWDRHWMTVLVETIDRPSVRRLTSLPPMFFIEAPPSKTKGCQRFSYELGWTASDAKVEEYYRRYLDLADRLEGLVLKRYLVTERRQDLTPIIQDVVAIILSRMET